MLCCCCGWLLWLAVAGCGWRAAVLWKARVLAGLAWLAGLVGCLGGWLACEQAVGWWRVTGVCMVCVWWVAVCLVLVGYDYGGEPINIAYQFSVFWNQATVLIHSCPHVIHRVNVCTKGDILAVNMWIFVVNWDCVSIRSWFTCDLVSGWLFAC